ncbi:hypothetical protein [Pseudarthrobacter sp. AL07]|uniref:hypothetical protein n=1 Tax=Pseudarthrobacter sp. AL07 TaxID=3042233 RepID=UPI00249A5B90|nr:hypothetical protein [Pseudarthrobacter sp. AL07]
MEVEDRAGLAVHDVARVAETVAQDAGRGDLAAGDGLRRIPGLAAAVLRRWMIELGDGESAPSGRPSYAASTTPLPRLASPTIR